MAEASLCVTFVRRLIPLKPGEVGMPALYDPPEGYRFETDVEFRERIEKWTGKDKS